MKPPATADATSSTACEAKLQQVGYEVDYLTPYMLTLLPLMWLGRRAAALTGRLRRASSPTDLALRELRLTPGVNGLLRFLMAREIPRVVDRRGLPFGTSLLAVARAGEPPSVQAGGGSFPG